MTTTTRPAGTKRGSSKRQSPLACCLPDACHRRVPTSDGGWACRAALEAGWLEDPAPTRDARQSGHGGASGPEAGPAIARPINHREHPAIALIEARTCSCCDGSLGSSDHASWLICGDCRCYHRVEGRDGRRYAAVVRDQRCRQRRKVAE